MFKRGGNAHDLMHICFLEGFSFEVVLFDLTLRVLALKVSDKTLRVS